MERRPARVPDEVLPHGERDHGVPGLEALALQAEEAVERRLLPHEAQRVESGLLLLHVSILPSFSTRTQLMA